MIASSHHGDCCLTYVSVGEFKTGNRTQDFSARDDEDLGYGGEDVQLFISWQIVDCVVSEFFRVVRSNSLLVSSEL